MRLIPVTHCQPGQRLARSIYTDSGATLLARGAILTKSMLDRLNHYQITALYIEDDKTPDSILPEVISEETRRDALELIYQTFRTVQDQPEQWQKVYQDQRLAWELQRVVSAMIDEILKNPTALNLLGTSCAIDHYIFTHSFHVAMYAIAVSWRMGLRDRELVQIGVGALLHDVGKMKIPLEILQKPGRLSDDEFTLMKQHTKYGHELLQGQDELLQFAAQCALEHHERCDGSGYPYRLTREAIHPFVQILAVCDVFDALSSHRVYRQAMLPHVAMEILFVGAQKQFHPKVVEAFRDTIALYPIGLLVTLNTGEQGVVAGYNPGAPSRPIVRVLKDAQGELVESPYEVDLAKQLNAVIIDADPILDAITSPSF